MKRSSLFAGFQVQSRYAVVVGVLAAVLALVGSVLYGWRFGGGGGSGLALVVGVVGASAAAVRALWLRT